MTNEEALFAGFMDGTDVVLAICENALNVLQTGTYTFAQVRKAIKDEVAGEIGKRMVIGYTEGTGSTVT